MTPPTVASTADHASVPARSKPAVVEPPLLDHAYDGIREYDNPLPGWWRGLFWATIVFSAGYWVWFHVGGWGKMPDAKYQVALGEYHEQKGARERAEMRDISEDTFVRSANDPSVIVKGRELYTAKCASCHAAEGQGLIGPNLTDRYQMHGTSRLDIFKTVRAGVPGTAMLAWGEQMPAADVVAVSTFVIAMRGKDVPGKEPQGAPVEAFR
jgi:cytochrome c oxidase cbb3-type subunit III